MSRLPRFPGHTWRNAGVTLAALVAVGLIAAKHLNASAANPLLNVSYDPTRELYQAIDRQFVAKYQAETGAAATIRQSHGGSSRQARSVISGQQRADVVTLALPSDVDSLRKRGLIADGWAARLPHQSQPYTSTIVFVVRKTNPKNIRDWPDLIQPGVFVITPDPRSSGAGKLAALAAWGAALRRGASEAEARDFLKSLYQHAPTLDSSARRSAQTFVSENIGDVQLTWEDEALREAGESKGDLEIVYPKDSILAEPAVAWVDANVARDGAEALARGYLEYLFTDEAQETLAKYGFRPINPAILAKYAAKLPKLDLFPISSIARDWDDANQKFFADTGVTNSVLTPATH